MRLMNLKCNLYKYVKNFEKYLQTKSTEVWMGVHKYYSLINYLINNNIISVTILRVRKVYDQLHFSGNMY